LSLQIKYKEWREYLATSLPGASEGLQYKLIGGFSSAGLNVNNNFDNDNNGLAALRNFCD
jgi:hypothetical protein